MTAPRDAPPHPDPPYAPPPDGPPPDAAGPTGRTRTRSPLRRSRRDRVLGGVCGGIARYLDIDPVLLRVAAVALALSGGVGVLAYIIAWVVLPEAPGDEPEPAAPPAGRHAVGAVLVGLGVLLLVRSGCPGSAPGCSGRSSWWRSAPSCSPRHGDERDDHRTGLRTGCPAGTGARARAPAAPRRRVGQDRGGAADRRRGHRRAPAGHRRHRAVEPAAHRSGGARRRGAARRPRRSARPRRRRGRRPPAAGRGRRGRDGRGALRRTGRRPDRRPRTGVPGPADWADGTTRVSAGTVTVDLTAAAPPGTGRMRVELSAGRVVVRLPDDAAVRVEDGVVAGTVVVDGATAQQGVDLRWTDPAGPPSGPVLTVDVGTGDVEVHRDAP